MTLLFYGLEGSDVIRNNKMAALTSCKKYLAISSCLGINIIDTTCGSEWKLSIPDVPPPSDSKAEPPPSKDSTSLSKASSDSTGQILCARFSEDGHLLAACNDKKDLAVWDGSAEWKILNCRKVMRRPVSLAFTLDKKVILVADKAGDVYSLNVGDDDSPTTPILGHVSMLLDLVLSVDNKYVITAERDEKIRVTHYPNTYNIQSFCLGHSEFVSSLRLLPANPNILVSSSGDCSLRFWDFVEGKELGCVPCIKYTSKHSNTKDDSNAVEVESSQPVNRTNCPKVAVKGCRCNPKDNIVAVLYFGLPQISLFQITKYDTIVEWQHVTNISTEKEPWDACFDAKGYLWVLKPVQNETIQVWKPEGVAENIQYIAVDKTSEDPVSAIATNINKNWAFFEGCLDVKDEMSTLFKQWYDNVKDYLERKEQRISGHAPKRKRQL